jgi:glycosyltransferase involved in cell wall biosynthesis
MSETNMRIAFLTAEYVTEASIFDGGLARYLYRVARILAVRGHEPEIFVRADTRETFVHDNILVHRVPHNSQIERLMRRLMLGRGTISIPRIITSWALRHSVLARHRQKPFDLVEASSYHSVGLALSHFRPFPLVVRIPAYSPLMTLMDSDLVEKVGWHELVANREYYLPTTASRDRNLSFTFERYTQRHADAVHSPGEFAARLSQEDTGVTVDVVRKPFTLEFEAANEPSDETPLGAHRYMLYFGSVKRYKGVMVLAKALAVCLAEEPDMHFVIAGKTDTLPSGETLVEHVFRIAGTHADRIHYFGRLTPDKLFPVIRHAQAVVFPSLVENVSNACLEAMALGRVVIGTQGVSFDEIIEDGVSGLLVPPQDADMLCRAMLRAWRMTDDERVNMGVRARELTQTLSPDNAVLALEQWYQHVIKTASK